MEDPRPRDSDFAAMFTEWTPLQRPGPLLAVMMLLTGIAMLAGNCSTLSTVTVLLSVPIIAFTARRRITLALYCIIAFLLHLTYWIVIGGRSSSRTDERVLVALCELCLVVSAAASWFYPHQYGGDPRYAWVINYSMGDCGLPLRSTRAHEEAGSEAEAASLNPPA